jgi:predicted metal-dependent phosphoesterase TrpH
MTDGDSGDTLTVDCHVHTAASYDSTAPLAAVLEAAARSRLDGLAVTDHDRIGAALEARALAASYDLVVLPGVEVSTAAGHLLAIGVTERPPPGEPLGRTVAEIRTQGGIAVVPHPFQRLRHGVPRHAIGRCDGLETFNAHTLTGVRNRQADRFATRHGHPRFGGSDAHRPSLVGRGYTEVELGGAGATAEGVLAAMRAGRVRPAGQRTPVVRYLDKYAYNARLKGPQFTRG